MFKELLSDKKKLGIYLVVIIIGLFAFYKYCFGGYKELKKNNNEENIFIEENSSYDDSNSGNNKQSSEIALKEKNIVVEIKGEVKKPDVYTMNEEAIIKDLIEAAGGTTENADLTSINRAKKLQNHELIYIKNKNEAGSEDISKTMQTTIQEENSMVNINSAGIDELKTLSGIGESKANNIIEYREKNGNFNSVNDITKVNGIGESTLEKIKDKIEV